MSDFYGILGVSPHASSTQVRAAYLAKMKIAHPDAAADGVHDHERASEITAAYWHLRDGERRAAYDRNVLSAALQLKADGSRADSRRRLLAESNRMAAAARGTVRPRRKALRAAAMIIVLTIAAPAALLYFSYLHPVEAAGDSQIVASPGAGTPMVQARRPLDSTIRATAANDFANILLNFGLAGAQTYSRQCFQDLTARPSLEMLDYCIAFDDSAGNWEEAQAPRPERRFGERERFVRYRSVGDNLREATAREAIQEEASFFERESF
jgi:hypothetical protein